MVHASSFCISFVFTNLLTVAFSCRKQWSSGNIVWSYFCVSDSLHSISSRSTYSAKWIKKNSSSPFSPVWSPFFFALETDSSSQVHSWILSHGIIEWRRDRCSMEQFILETTLPTAGLFPELAVEEFRVKYYRRTIVRSVFSLLMLFQKFSWYNFPCCIVISEFIETYMETFVVLLWLLHFPKVWNSLILIVWFWFILKPHFLGWAGKQGVWTQEGMFISSSAEHTHVVQWLLLISSQFWELFLGKSYNLGPKPWEYSPGS